MRIPSAQPPSEHHGSRRGGISHAGLRRGSFISGMMRAAGLLLLIVSMRTAAFGQTSTPRKIVVDASKDGGTWWAPQKEGALDPKGEHQGKRLAEYLRSRGWEVEEIGRGEDISERLKGAVIVIRANCASDYKESEVRAYRDFVTGGGSVLLLRGFVREDAANADKVAKEFGITFSKTVKAATIKRWGKLPLTEGLDLLKYNVGSVVTESPKGTFPLAYLDDDQLVGGLVKQGKGKVLFLSTIFALLPVPRAFIDRILNEFTPM